MSNRYAFALVFCLPFAGLAQSADYSKEALILQNSATKIKFAADGARDWQQTLSLKIQSEAAIRQFGVLSFAYQSESEQLTIYYVRVRKADGSVVETPASNVRDVATEVAAAAPTYIDIRQKQVPVKALGVGDVLEYSIHNVQQKPEVAGQFWYKEYFVSDSVVLKQTIEITVPKQQFIQVSSSKVKTETREEGDQKTYLWQYSQLEPSKAADNKKKPVADEDLPKVEITSFHSWEEVGNWWSALALPQAVVTPAIQDKAKELTAGLASDSEKINAIYNYVSLKFRYISISLGEGRYRPHSAGDVLANQYGDCKDKHTLFASLLQAAGIQAWPALIGAGMKFDASFPSPSQFNHVITVLPQNGKFVWLDTTSEVAPPGLLIQAIRDQQALVIPSSSKPILLKTPIDPPFKSSDLLDVKASLSAEGTLTGHFDYKLEGDSAMILRSGFRQLAPAQWQALAQQIVYGIGFAGDASSVDVAGLEDTDKPFQYSYDYTRKNYSDWAEYRITPPIPPIGFGPGDEADKPDEPFWVGAPGTLTYRSAVTLPKGFTTTVVPQNVKQTAPFADYTATYALNDGILTAERKLTIKLSKVALDQWPDYQRFIKALKDDQTTYVVLEKADGKAAAGNNPEADKLLNQAAQVFQQSKMNEARDLLSQAERLNPKAARLWGMYSFLAMRSGKMEEAIADGRKEIEYHPDELPAYQQLALFLTSSGRENEAIDVWRSALKVMPENDTAATQLAMLLVNAKRFAEVPSVLEKPIAAAPDNLYLKELRIKALLRGGHKEDGVAEARALAAATSDPMTLNDLAFHISDSETDTGFARDWVLKAIGQTEQSLANANLDSFSQAELNPINLLGAEWDTLGWIYFHQGDLANAQKYVEAAWQLSQESDVADHLGEIYSKQGKKAQAIQVWRLAVGARNRETAAHEHLRLAGSPITPAEETKASQELGALRTVKIPELPKQTGTAELFLLVSKSGVESIRLLDESSPFKNAVPAIQAARYDFPFPDEGPEKLIRRGILSCSTYTTPSCLLTLLLPSTAQAPQGHVQRSASDIVPAVSGRH